MYKHKVYKNIPYAETTYAACLLVSPHNRACHFYWVHGCDKVTSLPSSSSFCIPSAGYLHVMGGWGGTEWGVKRVCSVDEADCVCVSEAVVLAEEEREAVSLRIRPARFASSRLPGSLKLFDDRTGQHHHRWWWGGGICWCCCWWWGGMEACHLYTAVSFILSSSPPPPPARLSLPLLYPLVFLCCCCFAPFLRPLQAL